MKKDNMADGLHKFEIDSYGIIHDVKMDGESLVGARSLNLKIRPKEYSSLMIEMDGNVKIKGVLIVKEMINEEVCENCGHDFGIFIGRCNASCPVCGKRINHMLKKLPSKDSSQDR